MLSFQSTAVHMRIQAWVHRRGAPPAGLRFDFKVLQYACAYKCECTEEAQFQQGLSDAQEGSAARVSASAARGCARWMHMRLRAQGRRQLAGSHPQRKGVHHSFRHVVAGGEITEQLGSLDGRCAQAPPSASRAGPPFCVCSQVQSTP